MDRLGDIMQELMARIQNTQQEQRDFSESEDLSQYDCIICRDKESLIIYKNTGAQRLDPDPDFPKDFEMQSEEFTPAKVNPLHAARWTQILKDCSCHKRKAEQRRIENMLQGSGMSKKFKKRTFDSLIWLDPADFPEPWSLEVEKLMQQQRDAYDMTLDYAINFEEHQENGEGIGLFGDVGTAKTHLLAAKTNYLIGKGIQSVWINTTDLFKQLRESFERDENGKPISGTRASEIINLLMHCDDLTLDDLGKEKPTEFVLDTLYNIVNHRYEEELPISFSTNCTASELKDQLGQATYRRLVEPAAGRMMSMKGHSFEQIIHKVREGSRTWQQIKDRKKKA